MKVELLDKMGDDLMVVNAARVSYDKHTETLRQSDIRLLDYLALHNHFSPFTHPQLTFRIECNIAVANQLKRHQVGLTVNEVSRRYVDDAPEFDLPDVWRSAPGVGQSKQGSGEPYPEQSQVNDIIEHVLIRIRAAYTTLIDGGIAPEQARLVLPMALVTKFYWTGSLMAFLRVCKERLAPEAQQETRAVATEIYQHLQSWFPYSISAWNIVPASSEFAQGDAK